MIDLIFDTETTGFYDKYSDLGAPGQPHMLQLAALLCEGPKVLSHFVAYTRPVGDYRIPLEAARVHGITHELIDKSAIDTILALTMLKQMMARADRIVAHNLEFDINIVKIAAVRCGKTWASPDVPMYCTMLASMDHCKLPGFKGQHKWPKLIEAYVHFFGEPGDNVRFHDAFDDASACHRILQHLDSLSVDARPATAG